VNAQNTAVGVVLASIAITGTYFFHAGGISEDSSRELPLSVGQTPSDVARFEFDWSDSKALVGAQGNILVGRVMEKVGEGATWSRNTDRPHTLFDVEVIYNVKGNPRGVIRVMQNGISVGDMVRVIRSGDPPEEIMMNSDSSLLLKPGHTYLLFLGYDSMRSRYFLEYSPRLQREISDDNALTSEKLNELARRDERVYELLAAYVNEVPIRANVLNRFDLLSAAEKQVVFDKFEELIPSRPVPEITPKNFDFSEPAIENRITYCMDGADNDKDGLIDFADPECKSFFIENNRGLCRDGTDDDADGLVDVADPDCAPFYPQSAPPPAGPTPTPPPSAPTSTPPAPPPPPPAPSSTPTSTGQ
jgi:hypothetical protein